MLQKLFNDLQVQAMPSSNCDIYGILDPSEPSASSVNRSSQPQSFDVDAEVALLLKNFAQSKPPARRQMSAAISNGFCYPNLPAPSRFRRVKKQESAGIAANK